MPPELGGVPIGELGESHSAAKTALSRYGIKVSKTSLISLRKGDEERGGELEEKIRCARLLEDNDALNKDYVYLAIARAAVRLRKPQAKPREQTLNSAHLTANVADNLEMRQTQVEMALKAMRTEVLYCGDLDEDRAAIFYQTAQSYIEDHLLQTNRSFIAEEMRNTWNGTIPDFYKILYKSKQAVRAWTPYEVAFLRYYYQGRIAGGSNLSPFDRLVLEIYIRNNEFSYHADLVKDSINISLTNVVLTGHRNFLVHGKPANPNILR